MTNNLKVSLTSLDHASLDRAVATIVDSLKSTGAGFLISVQPVVIDGVTGSRIQGRSLGILNVDDKVINKLQKLDVPDGVEISVR